MQCTVHILVVTLKLKKKKRSMLFLATIMGEREWEQGLREEGKLRIYNGAQGERIRNKQGAKEEEGKHDIC